MSITPATAIALNRFGLGARPDQPPPERPKEWLFGQLDRFERRPAAIAALPTTRTIAGVFPCVCAELCRTLAVAARGRDTGLERTAASPRVTLRRLARTSPSRCFARTAR